jgi:hypothetical protein
MRQLDPMLISFYRYWESRCGGRALPRRADIDPSHIPALLPNVQLIDVLDGGSRFRFRLVGTAIVAAFGAELTGRYFDEVMTAQRLAIAVGHYRRVCENMRPIYICAAYTTTRYGDIIASRVIAPLSADSVAVNMAIALQTFEFGGLLHNPIDASASIGADTSMVIPLPAGADLAQLVAAGAGGVVRPR